MKLGKTNKASWHSAEVASPSLPQPIRVVAAKGIPYVSDANRFQTLFGVNKNRWAAASPARFNPAAIAKRVREGKAPHAILLDQSREDQLVPFNQLERFEAQLGKSEGFLIMRGDRCKGRHAAPWEQGFMLWNSVQDALVHLRKVPLRQNHTV